MEGMWVLKGEANVSRNRRKIMSDAAEVFAIFGQVLDILSVGFMFFIFWVSLVGKMEKNLLALQETRVLFLGCEDPLGERNGYPHQYSCLENFMARGAWCATSMGLQRLGHDWATKTYTILISLSWPWGQCKWLWLCMLWKRLLLISWLNSHLSFLIGLSGSLGSGLLFWFSLPQEYQSPDPKP